MLQSLFAVGILFLCILTNIRGEQSRVYSTNEASSWLNARGKCKQLTNERNCSYFTTRLGWTSFSAKYLPWVEYKGCFEYWDLARFKGQEKQVTEGEQLQECIIHCNKSDFFGLQESTCLCLPNLTLTDGSVKKLCNKNVATCSGDSFAFCGNKGSECSFSVYRKALENINASYDSFIGNCLEFDNRNRGTLKPNDCATESYPICYNEVFKTFSTGKSTKSKWTDAFENCELDILANYSTVNDKINDMNQFTEKFWLSNTRRWTRIKDVIGNPYFCVAAKIEKNGDVKRLIHRCNESLPALCVTVQQTSTGAPSKTYSTGRSKGVQETSLSSLNFMKTTSQDFVESTSSDLPGKDGISAIVIIAIVAATILIVIVVLVTIILCRRKRNIQVPISNESLAMVGNEVMYAQVNKPIVKREKNTLSQKSQPAASDDTYDHMDHRRLSQTQNTIESNYDTMRSIAIAEEEENNYDHVTGTRIESKRFVVDGVSNYSHVEVDIHEVKDI